MKKALLILICLSFTLLAVPMFSHAFDTYKCGDQEVTIWGFLRNNLGMFERTQEFTNSGNQLATARTWLRAYMDWKMSEQFKFYTSVQFVWEPWYKVEEGNPISENGGIQQHRKSGWKNYSEFDDVNDVIREVYIEWKPNKQNTIKFGRQIAIWGESLVDRIGDVIHPNDNRFSFAFANLEDTRIPQYMIRGIHMIDSLNSSFEWIVNPLLLEGKYSVARNAGYYNMWGKDEVEERFAIHPENRIYSFPLAYILNLEANDMTMRLYEPDKFYSVILPTIATIPGAVAPKERYPDNFEDTRFGFRTSTMLGGYQFGLMYWHTQEYMPMGSWGESHGTLMGFPLRTLYLEHPTYDIIGFYMNKQLPWPGVIRGEAIYSPNKPFNELVFSALENGLTRRDYVKYMVAYDLRSFLYFDWHKTAAFDVVFEHIGEWVPNADNLRLNSLYVDKFPTYHGSFNINISTNWFYDLLETSLTFGYDTFGNSGLFMPTVKWLPGWMNKMFSAEIKYIGIYGDNDYQGLGVFRKKDMFVLTTQLNF